MERRDVAVILLWFLVFGLGKPFTNSLKPALHRLLGKARPVTDGPRSRTAEYLAGGAVSIPPESAGLTASEWHDPEGDPATASWRWAKSEAPSLRWHLPPGPPTPAYRLDLRLQSVMPLRVGMMLNGRSLGEADLSSAGVENRSLLVDRDFIEVPGRNRLELLLPIDAIDPIDAAADSPGPRLAYHGASVRPLPYLARGEMSFRDEVYLWSGWSVAEPRFRWTDGAVSSIALPLRRVGSRPWKLVVAGTTGGPQRLEIEVNGRHSGSWELDGWELQELEIDLQPGVLRAGLNRVDLHFPAPRRVEGDPRLLGFAFQWLLVGRDASISR